MTDAKNLRIVSLIPSATEIVTMLGLTDALVGRSHECDYPPEIQDRPVCTGARLNSETPSAQIHLDVNELLQKALSIYQIKIDVLEQLQPTHILTQDQCDVCAVSLADVKNAVGQLTHSQPEIISLQPNLLADIWADIERVADAFGVGAEPMLLNLESRVKICQQKTQALPELDRPKVACIEWTDPLMVAGNWIPELVQLAGGQPLVGVPGQPSPKLEWKSLLSANPDIIVFMPCGFDLNRTRSEANALAQHPEWQSLHAVQTGRVYVTDGNWYFNRPGPRLADSLEILAEILHPEIFQYGYKGTAWETL
ncbi:cobalamin-binding protein [Microseira wollei]|uniref:ABC transporter substrate-binding protein n=1 Tax=Microseira wollei NIES-4236 TaxID=2530354 RepID=A0AAV3X3E2_9CYAN|nr:cobalamin-binding protein [Microseira wollei]GET36589.1 ABC transporter; substrate-binding protein [Microseira wollei NIES-4236]